MDLLHLRHTFVENIASTTNEAVEVVTSMSILELYGVTVTAVAIVAASEWYRRWRKGKGLRMALKHEKHRIRELLSEGLNDMILDWEVKGTVSHQEGDALYTELSKKLDLPDLIPRQRRFKIVKNEIKSRLRSPKHAVHPKIPGDKPGVAARKKFKQTKGNLLSKFWKF